MDTLRCALRYALRHVIGIKNQRLYAIGIKNQRLYAIGISMRIVSSGVQTKPKKRGGQLLCIEFDLMQKRRTDGVYQLDLSCNDVV